MKEKIIKTLSYKVNISFIFFLISIITSLLLIININKLNIIPNKYFILVILLEITINTLIYILILRKKKALHIFGLLLFFILISINIILNSYIKTTDKVIDKLFKDEVSTNIDFIIITSINNEVNYLEEIDTNQSIYYDKYSKNIKEACKYIEKHSLIETDTISNTLNLIKDNPSNYLLTTKGNYEYLMDSSILFNKNNYKIIKEFTITIKEERNNTVKKSFTIYLNGVDFTGIMRDFNMLITVNTKKKKVLLTGVLRGYYIDVPSYNMKDTLMCLGSLDSKVSKEALENLFQTKIDYTINVNTNSLVQLVDSLGGIEFCSDYSFKTTHALINDSYDDKGKNKLIVKEGCRNYNGIEILTIARERLNLKNNERGRLDNCKKIMVNIGKELISTSTILNHKEVLNNFSNLYTTDMNKEIISILFKSVLENYKDYEIEEYQLDGIDGSAIGHLGTMEVGVTFPDENNVNEAREKIKNILK